MSSQITNSLGLVIFLGQTGFKVICQPLVQRIGSFALSEIAEFMTNPRSSADIYYLT